MILTNIFAEHLFVCQLQPTSNPCEADNSQNVTDDTQPMGIDQELSLIPYNKSRAGSLDLLSQICERGAISDFPVLDENQPAIEMLPSYEPLVEPTTSRAQVRNFLEISKYL